MKATPHHIPINPKLPENFGCTDNNARPFSHMKWWNRPYIETYSWDEALEAVISGAWTMRPDRARWFERWPSGVRHDVRCLDGGAWDRPTCWGSFATLEEAIECAKHGKNFR